MLCFLLSGNVSIFILSILELIFTICPESPSGKEMRFCPRLQVSLGRARLPFSSVRGGVRSTNHSSIRCRRRKKLSVRKNRGWKSWRMKEKVNLHVLSKVVVITTAVPAFLAVIYLSFYRGGRRNNFDIFRGKTNSLLAWQGVRP